MNAYRDRVRNAVYFNPVNCCNETDALVFRKARISKLDIFLALILAGAAAYVFFRVDRVLHYQWDWQTIFQYLFRYVPETGNWVPNLLMDGFFTTIRLSVWGTVLAMGIGLVMGLARTSPSLFNRLISRTYVEVVRNLPPLVLIFIFYFFFSDQILPVFGLDEAVAGLPAAAKVWIQRLFAPPRQFSAFLSALVTLSIFEGAYITEIVRSGIESLEKGQWEASQALGFSRYQQLRHIILPQAFARTLPPLAGQFISTIKDSAIVSVISIQELTFQGMELMSATYLTFEIWITITVLYLLLTLPCSLAVERLEIFMRRSQA